MKTTVIGTALALLVTASAAGAQQTAPAAPADARWQPWVGCWQLLDESVRGQDEVSADATGTRARARRSNTSTRVCVAPTATGVTLTTMVGSERALEETIVADGVSHAVADAECRGTKRSEWSQAAPRLYTSADISCGDQAPRKISSLSMMTPGPTWTDIQVIDIEGRANIRIRRFERAAGQPQARSGGRSPFVGETSWTVDDVKEASAKLAREAVQGALVELGTGFNLKGKQLLDMQQAGVSDTVIDLMIALSYPKRFVVERAGSAAPPPSGFGYGISDEYDGMWPFYLDSMFWSSYYSPFAYRYWGQYDPYYFPGSGYVVLPPSSAGPVASGEGRVVDGRGYTRVSTREPVRVNDGGGTSGTMTSGGSSSSGGSSGGVSSGGYSSGGGDSGGRTAVPRPPGQ
jgi:hypothetical protein